MEAVSGFSLHVGYRWRFCAATLTACRANRPLAASRSMAQKRRKHWPPIVSWCCCQGSSGCPARGRTAAVPPLRWNPKRAAGWRRGEMSPAWQTLLRSHNAATAPLVYFISLTWVSLVQKAGAAPCCWPTQNKSSYWTRENQKVSRTLQLVNNKWQKRGKLLCTFCQCFPNSEGIFGSSFMFASIASVVSHFKRSRGCLRLSMHI